MNTRKKFEELIKETQDQYEKEKALEATAKTETTSILDDISYDKSVHERKKMTLEELNDLQNLGTMILNYLRRIKQDPTNELLKRLTADLHKDWLTLTLGYYRQDHHYDMVDKYVYDDKFAKHYKVHGEGIAEILREAVYKYC